MRYSDWIQEHKDQKKLRIWNFFTQWNYINKGSSKMKEARQGNNALHKLISHFNFSELQTMWQSLTTWSCLVTSCFPNYNPGHNILELYNVLVRLIQVNSTWFLLQKTLFTNCFKSCRTTSYSQTCSNDHLYLTTTRLRGSTLSPTKPILIQLFLHEMSTCLKRPVNTFFCPSNEKRICLKRPLQSFTQRRTDIHCI